MTFEDILREQLVGKKFKLDKYVHPKNTGYFAVGSEIAPYYKGITPTTAVATITGLTVYYDVYDGDYINMTIEVDGLNQNYDIWSLTNEISFI